MELAILGDLIVYGAKSLLTSGVCVCVCVCVYIYISRVLQLGLYLLNYEIHLTPVGATKIFTVSSTFYSGPSSLLSFKIVYVYYLWCLCYSY
jgi:hypothetical protein